ncbi:MAG TPA: cupin domain-containing protein [Acidimicrobiales bacterium]|nr:cupin domain-containing protein [Acidimicrobiales bacterium]
MADGWHRPLHHTPAGSLDAGTAQTPGMDRREAISGRRSGSAAIWMGETVVAPSVASADHHHGESETAIFVASGHPAFVFIDPDSGVERRVETSPGDYVFVPPWTPHREENPSPDEPAVVVIARSTQEAIVVNLADLHGTPAG